MEIKKYYAAVYTAIILGAYSKHSLSVHGK